MQKIEIMINRLYFMVGNLVLLQCIGIPMGTDSVFLTPFCLAVQLSVREKKFFGSNRNHQLITMVAIWGFSIKIVVIPMAPQQHWPDATKYYVGCNFFTWNTKRLKNNRMSFHCFLCLFQYSSFTADLFLHCNCLTFGTKSKNFNMHLTILRN